ncbi:GNAT family N-acetyltransferase, partial [Clostridioides difficile]
QGNVVGAIWVRIMNDYGHIDNDTPSLAMSVFQKYRGQGIGTSATKALSSFRFPNSKTYSCNSGQLMIDLGGGSTPSGI